MFAFGRALGMSCGVVLLLAQSARAQRALPALQWSAVRSDATLIVDSLNSAVLVSGIPRVGLQPREPSARPAPWWAPVASAVVPGSGQFGLRQQRSVVYAVADAYLLLQAMSSQRDGNRDRSRYRSIASDVARKAFGGARPVGDWDYYESMEKFTESGAYDRVPGGALDPESDPRTYNGYRWLVARETYWRAPDAPPPTSSPEYARALSYYAKTAATDQFRWSWRDAGLEQDTYRQTIASANRSYQRVVNVIGLIGANHLMSMVDAYVSVRVRRYGGAGLAGLRTDGVITEVSSFGDPALGQRQLRTGLRLAGIPRF